MDLSDRAAMDSQGCGTAVASVINTAYRSRSTVSVCFAATVGCRAVDDRGQVARLLRLGDRREATLNALSHPHIGGLYRIETAIMSGSDPKPKRPAVVIRMPPPGLGVVTVLTRTTQVNRYRGVRHPRDAAIGLTKDGVFSLQHTRTLDLRYFLVPQAVEYLADVEEDILIQLLKLWENG
jgi:mRNA-degrading endonuclease toxin of MazEF toxin-antitoxin module